jgi:hypothetical protein
MKRAKRRPRPHGRGGAAEFFDYGPWRFNINKATVLASNGDKYRPQMLRPTADWIGPFIDIDFRRLDHCDLSRPVIVATVVQDGRPWRLLIDGNHRVARALRDQAAVPVVTLDLEDTLKVLRAPPGMVEVIKRRGQQLGLLPRTSVSP